MMGFSYTEGELIYVLIYFKTKAVMFSVCLYYAAYCTVQTDGTLKREKLVVSVTLWEEWCRGLLEQFWRPNILHTHAQSPGCMLTVLAQEVLEACPGSC